jgi:hypothetical protein
MIAMIIKIRDEQFTVYWWHCECNVAKGTAPDILPTQGGGKI